MASIWSIGEPWRGERPKKNEGSTIYTDQGLDEWGLPRPKSTAQTMANLSPGQYAPIPGGGQLTQFPGGLSVNIKPPSTIRQIAQQPQQPRQPQQQGPPPGYRDGPRGPRPVWMGSGPEPRYPYSGTPLSPNNPALPSLQPTLQPQQPQQPMVTNPITGQREPMTKDNSWMMRASRINAGPGRQQSQFGQPGAPQQFPQIPGASSFDPSQLAPGPQPTVEYGGPYSPILNLQQQSDEQARQLAQNAQQQMLGQQGAFLNDPFTNQIYGAGQGMIGAPVRNAMQNPVLNQLQGQAAGMAQYPNQNPALNQLQGQAYGLAQNPNANPVLNQLQGQAWNMAAQGGGQAPFNPALGAMGQAGMGLLTDPSGNPVINSLQGQAMGLANQMGSPTGMNPLYQQGAMAGMGLFQPPQSLARDIYSDLGTAIGRQELVGRGDINANLANRFGFGRAGAESALGQELASQKENALAQGARDVSLAEAQRLPAEYRANLGLGMQMGGALQDVANTGYNQRLAGLGMASQLGGQAGAEGRANLALGGQFGTSVQDYINTALQQQRQGLGLAGQLGGQWGAEQRANLGAAGDIAGQWGGEQRANLGLAGQLGGQMEDYLQRMGGEQRANLAAGMGAAGQIQDWRSQLANTLGNLNFQTPDYSALLGYMPDFGVSPTNSVSFGGIGGGQTRSGGKGWTGINPPTYRPPSFGVGDSYSPSTPRWDQGMTFPQYPESYVQREWERRNPLPANARRRA